MPTAYDFENAIRAIDDLLVALDEHCAKVASEWPDVELKGPKRDEVNGILGQGDASKFLARSNLESARETAQRRHDECVRYQGAYNAYLKDLADGDDTATEPTRPWYCDPISVGYY